MTISDEWTGVKSSYMRRNLPVRAKTLGADESFLGKDFE